MQILLGVLKQTSGEVLLNDQPLSQYLQKNPRQYLQQVQPIFQDPYGVFNPFYKAIHLLQKTALNLKLIARKEEFNDFITPILFDVGLEFHFIKNRYPHELSGGQRQRLMVARALMVKPQIILADEPVSMIDASLRANILDNILLLKNHYGITVIYITHDLTTAFQICDTLNVMYQGEIVESGPCEEVILRPKHTYTQSLISSIPTKKKNVDWMQLTS
jgi:peptide/nickel transport system ATP-binding protein